MKKAKQLCSMMLCVVMAVVFTITPASAATENTTTPTVTITGTNAIEKAYAQFTSTGQEVKATLAQTASALNVTLEATIAPKTGTTGTTIKSEAVSATTSTTGTTDVTFKFKETDLNTLAVGEYNITAASTSGSATAVTSTNIGTIRITKGTPVITVEKKIELTKSRSSFQPNGESITVKLDKASFASSNPQALNLTATITNGKESATATVAPTTNGNVTFNFAQADLNKLPEGKFSVIVTSDDKNTVNDTVKTTLDGEITITPIKNATITTPQTFDLAKQADVVIGTENNGRTLIAIKNGTTTLTKGTDYTVSDNYVVIHKTYLSKFAKGTQYLTFDFDDGSDPVCQVNIINSKKAVNITLKGYSNKTITTLYNKAFGSTLPGWNKSKYKAAGRKGYQFAGWTYNGKTITTVPETTSDITLVAKFTKLSVGKAASLSVKGKSGKGIGFIATSRAYTKADGSRRGFRFRYSPYSSMKYSNYKTTGLAKNVYTQTGLSKNRRYYVRVRYYYYDSTNAKVYGAYSNSKSVKAY